MVEDAGNMSRGKVGRILIDRKIELGASGPILEIPQPLRLMQ